jgi:hypothetical protein
MNAQSRFQSRRMGSLLLLCLLAGCAAASGGWPNSHSKIDFEYTGTVYDAVTRQPIEGAYVFASYHVDVGPQPAFKSWCVRTRGMYTGKDGKYHFPIEKLDGQSPIITSAIKPGYFFGSFDFPKGEVWRRQDASSYSDRNLYLKPQDPANPSFLIGIGEEYCSTAITKEDAAAGAHFLRIELDERIKYGALQQSIDAVRRMIEHLEALPARGYQGAAPHSEVQR